MSSFFVLKLDIVEEICQIRMLPEHLVDTTNQRRCWASFWLVWGDPRWPRPPGTGPSVASGIIRFHDLWFVKSGERAIRWIFGGVWPAWAETARAKNSTGGGADLADFFAYGNQKEHL